MFWNVKVMTSIPAFDSCISQKKLFSYHQATKQTFQFAGYEVMSELQQIAKINR